jgi:hypothetical protein
MRDLGVNAAPFVRSFSAAAPLLRFVVQDATCFIRVLAPAADSVHRRFALAVRRPRSPDQKEDIMRRLLLAVALGHAAFFVFLTPTGALASDRDKLTYFTFSGPVQVPGATLPAGTYQFKRAIFAGNGRTTRCYSSFMKRRLVFQRQSRAGFMLAKAPGSSSSTHTSRRVPSQDMAGRQRQMRGRSGRLT